MRRENNQWLGKRLLKTYALSMENKMAAGAFKLTKNYGSDISIFMLLIFLPLIPRVHMSAFSAVLRWRCGYLSVHSFTHQTSTQVSALSKNVRSTKTPWTPGVLTSMARGQTALKYLTNMVMDCCITLSSHTSKSYGLIFDFISQSE